MEVRLVTAILISQFEISFAENEDGTKVWTEMTDSFTANPGPLNLVFSPLPAAAAALKSQD